MATKISRSFIAGMVILMLTLNLQCNPDDESGGIDQQDIDPLDPKPAITTSVAGVVVDEAGKPLEGAEVLVHGESAMTGKDGAFSLDDIQVPGNRCVVQSLKEGFFKSTRAFEPVENGRTETRLVMMESAITHTFLASEGNNALIGGSEVRIPANGLVTASGSQYSGPVNMSVRYMDPSAGNFGVLVPGGDMVARREDQSTSMLYSFGILRVQMTDQTGDPLQLSPGSESTLVMEIPEAQLASAPQKIPLWYFDEDAGVWQEEGSAVREGNRYVGTVKHFTDWNCDDPTEGATIVGRLVDCDNKPSWGIVEFGQVTSDPQSSTETGERDGRFSRRVPDGVQITVVISDPLMITPLTQNERGKVIVIVPPLAPGQVYDVGDIQTFPCPSTLKAAFNLNEGDAINYISFDTENGTKPLFEPGSNISIQLPPSIEIVMTVYTASGISVARKINTASEDETLDLGVIDLTSTITPDSEITITGKTICFGEIESNGQISVTWNNNTNTGINYTSPEADGTFSIKAPSNASVEISSSTESGTWAQTLQTPSAPGSTLDLGTIELCENTSVGETSFKITGDGFNNKLITLVSNKNSSNSNMGAYMPGDDITIAVVDDLGDELYMTLYFPGNTTGVREQVNEVYVTIERKLPTTSIFYWGGLTIENTDVTLNVTKYEAVGGVIEGEFSGTFLVQDSNKEFTGQTVKITEGKFSVKRYPDIK